MRGKDGKKAAEIEDNFFIKTYQAPLPTLLKHELRSQLHRELKLIRKQTIEDLNNDLDTEIIYRKTNQALRTLLKKIVDRYIEHIGAKQPHFNVLLLGSFSGEDATPWSDLEIVILYDDKCKEARNYLIQLSQWLSFTFLAFDEPLGLRLDKAKNPLGIDGNGALICTPAMLAARQNKRHYQHESDNHLSGSLLFIDSLCGQPSLFEEYKQELGRLLEEPAWYNENMTRKTEFAGYQFLRAKIHPISIDKQVDVK